MRNERAWYHIEERGLLWGMRFLAWAYRWFGRAMFSVLLYPVVVYYVLTNSTGRNASLDYLARLNAYHPDCTVRPTWMNVVRHFTSFAHSIMDRLSAWTGALTLENLVFEDRRPLESALASGRGVVLVGAHLGCLEVSRAFARLKADIRLNVLVHSHNAERMNRLLAPVSGEHQFELIEVTEVGPATAIRLQQKIEQGELVAIVADRVPVQGRTSTVTAPFLGHDAEFPQGPWVLAHLLGCPVMTLFCIKRGGRYHIYCERFAERVHLPRANRSREMRQVVERYVGQLERFCLQAPLQWYNFYPFWLSKDDTVDQ